MALVLPDAPSESSPDSVARHGDSDNLLYVLWGLFWLLLVGVAIRDYAHGGGREWWKPVLWEGSAMVFSTLLLLLMRHRRGRFAPLLDRPWRWFAAHLKWLPLAGAAIIASFYGLRHAVYALLGQRYVHEPWLQLFPYEIARFALFACLWLGVIFALDSHAHWQTQQRRLLMLQRSLSEARLARLSAQLRPHFLFNALNTVSALMHLDVARADRLVAALGDLLRASLESAPQQRIPLSRELRLLELYTQVMMERFADRVTLEWQVEPAALDAPVPALLLQPLVENAFKHGVERTTGPVRIRIAARVQRGQLEISVANTGLLQESSVEGIGLLNCRERLAELHGDAASLQLLAAGREVEARLILPATPELA